MSATNRATLTILVLASVIATLTLVFVASSSGIRGTDQYQYAADAETLRKEQPALTNLFFPAKIVRNQEVQESTNYFSHNGPLLHIVAKSSTRFDVQTTWIFLNVIFHLITAIVIFCIAKSFTSKPIATIVTSLYFTSPIALWQVSNVLQEMFFSALVSMCLLCYYFRNNLATTLLLPLCYFIGVLSHPIFVVVGLLHGFSQIIFFLFKRDYKLVLDGTIAITAVFSALTFSAQWFPTQFQPGLKEIIVSAIPNYSNMVYHFQQVIPGITIDLLYDKLIAATNKQFFSLRNAPFFIFTNMAGFGLLFLLYASLVRKSVSMYLVAPLAVLFGAYIGIIVLQQNHARFQQIISPASFLIIALVMHRIRFDITKPLMLALCLLLAVDVALATHLKSQAILQTKAITELIVKTKNLPNEAKLLAVDIREHGALAYALRPNKVLTINTKLMQLASVDAATTLFEPDYILVKGDSEGLFDNRLSLISTMVNPHFGELKLYRYE